MPLMGHKRFVVRHININFNPVSNLKWSTEPLGAAPDPDPDPVTVTVAIGYRKVQPPTLIILQKRQNPDTQIMEKKRILPYGLILFVGPIRTHLPGSVLVSLDDLCANTFPNRIKTHSTIG